MGRVITALSGAEARGGSATNDRPYNETLTYDAMNHLTTLERINWDRWDGSGPSTFVNNRVQGWIYDADGRALISTGYYTYDAAGRVVSFGNESSYKTEQQFAGDRLRAKTVARRYDDELDQWVTEKVTYYLTSSVLGGVVVTELSEQGAKERTLVHVGGSVLASQVVIGSTQSVEWEHRDPSGASFRTTDATGQWSAAAEIDAVGANAGLFKPFTWNVPNKTGLLAPYSGVADMLNNPGGACTLDRMPIPCEIRNSLIEAGAVQSEYPYDKEPSTSNRSTAANHRVTWWPKSKDIINHGLGLFEMWVPPEFLADRRYYGGVLFVLPQNSTTIPLDINKIPEYLNNPTCSDFVTNLLNMAARLYPNNPGHSTNATDLFNAIKDGKGAYFLGTFSFNGKPAGGTTSGSISNGDAAVSITPRIYPGVPDARQVRMSQEIYALAGLHETIHLAGYSDQQLAQAAREVTSIEEHYPAANETNPFA